MKIFKKIFIITLVVITFAAGLFYFFYIRPGRVTPILMYHSVSDDKSSSLNVAPGNFSRQMKFLHKSGYSVISLDELVHNIKKGIRFMPKTVVITFDDGYEDNYLHAFPVLARYDMPATIFLITDYCGKRKGYVNWDQVLLMMTNGISFGGHTRNNVYLPAVKDLKRLHGEVAGCREDIKQNTGKEANFFCYPTGGFNDTAKKAVKEAGYKGACTTNRGLGRFNRDVYELKRVKITNSDMNKPFHFRGKLSGYYNLFRSLRAGD